MSLRIPAAVTFFIALSSASAPASTAPVVHIPLTFMENVGQAGPTVRYIGNGPQLKAWFQDKGVVLRHRNTVAKLTFVSATARAESPSGIAVSGVRPIAAKANLLVGSDRRSWRTGLPLFDAIRYTGIWPGVELNYAAADGQLKAEYVVAPGAAVEPILLRFDGNPRIQDDGSLRVKTSSGDFVESKPVCYQLIQGERKEVPGGFRETPDGAVGFWTADYDHTQPLVIDPSILLSGYFGGDSEDTITGVSVDSLSNVVVAGWTSSNNLPTTGGFQENYDGNVDAFVAAFTPNGGSLIYCTYLGGSSDDRAFGLAVDSARNVYVTGQTSSTNFPVAGSYQKRLTGTRDAFVTKLNPAGNALIYSTYLGGSSEVIGYAIAVSSAYNAVVVGDTTSSNLPVTAGVAQPKFGGSQDAFVANLSPTGGLIFLTYLGGNGVDHASSVAVGSAGAFYIGGYTYSTNFPTVNAFQPKSGGGQDGFVARLLAAGNSLSFSTYFGGTGGSNANPEEVNAICLNPQGTMVYVAGTTSSSNFPVTAGAYQSALRGETDGFVADFNVHGVLQQSTYLGGSLNDSITAMALDFYGYPYVTGSTDSPDFPVQQPIQSTNAGDMDAFVAKLNLTLSSVTWSTYLGGWGNDGANAIAVDFYTSVLVAGQTSSGNFPAVGNLQPYSTEVLSSFVTKLKPNFTLGVAYASNGQLAFTTDPWHVATDIQTTFYGESTDIPIAGDWTGTGTKEIGIFRNGTWYLDTNGNGILDSADQVVQWGQAGDIPVVGDWLGTGRIALGLYRQGTFILDQSGHLTGIPTGLSDATFAYGQAGDLPVAADWNGSGTAKVGVFNNGLWQVDYSGTRNFQNAVSYTYGQAGDLPVVGDWDSSGRPSKIGIYRQGLWVLNYDGNNQWGVPYSTELTLGFGFAGYTPLIF